MPQCIRIVWRGTTQTSQSSLVCVVEQQAAGMDGQAWRVGTKRYNDAMLAGATISPDHGCCVLRVELWSMSPLPATHLTGWHAPAAERMRYRQLGNTDMLVSTVGLGGCVVGGVYPDKGDLQEICQVHHRLQASTGTWSFYN